MASSSFSVTKIDKLKNPQVFVHWRRRFKGLISPEDANLLSLQAETDANAENHSEWVTPNAKRKSTIILHLGDSALANTRLFVDGDETANNLCDDLTRTYTMSLPQAIPNLQVNLEGL